MRVAPITDGRPTKYPFPLFRVGDAYTLACASWKEHSIRSAASAWGRRKGVKFEVTKVPAGLVLRRVA